MVGRPGPPPKPSAVEKLQGRPSHRPLPPDEPQPATLPGVPSPPRRTEFGPVARRVWVSKAAEMQRIGTLTSVDLDEFANYCVLHEELAEMRATKRRWLRDKELRDGVWRWYARIAGHIEKIAQYSDRFGLTPAARRGLAVPMPKDHASAKGPQDPHDELAARRASRQSHPAVRA